MPIGLQTAVVVLMMIVIMPWRAVMSVIVFMILLSGPNGGRIGYPETPANVTRKTLRRGRGEMRLTNFSGRTKLVLAVQNVAIESITPPLSSIITAPRN